MRKYYSLYEERYKKVYNQGIDYWVNTPKELKYITEELNKFIKFFSIQKNQKIIEFGCGEGYLGYYLVKKGFNNYLGIDLSKSAIEKAKNRIKTISTNNHFIQRDILSLKNIKSNSFDISIDNYFLHMLVTDQDRRLYLSTAFRILKNDGKAYFHENYQRKTFNHKIKSYEDFIKICPYYLSKQNIRKAYSNKKYVDILLNFLPCRQDNKKGYISELKKIGFKIKKSTIFKWHIAIYAKKN